MPGFDWIPGVSQIKSTIQLITGDVEGAARTQKNFFQECPVVSQATSGVQLLAGDIDGAIETQMRCLGTINNVTNATPVVGHIKGVIHHAVGDHEGGNQALNAASRTTVVLGSGAVAGIATGPVGAVAAGIYAGTTYDTVDSAINDKPKGVWAAIETVKDNPNGGNVFDLVAGVAGDGVTGFSGGQIGTKVVNQITGKSSVKIKYGKEGAKFIKNPHKGLYRTLIRFWKPFTKVVPGLEKIMMKIILKYPESSVYFEAIVHASSYQMAEDASEQLEALLNQLKEKLPELYDEIKRLLDEGEILIKNSEKQ